MKINKFLDSYYVDRKNTNAIKWSGMQKEYGTNELLPLWVADMDFKAPKAVVKSLEERVKHGVFGYSFTPLDYYQAYIDWQKRHYQIEIKQEWIIFDSGVVHSLRTLINVLTKENDAILIMQPVYYPFMEIIKSSQRKLIISDLIKNDAGKYVMDYVDIKSKIRRENVRLVINCSPHNPVGRIWSEKELEALMEICYQNETYIISDEIHHDLIIGDKPFVSALSIKSSTYNNYTIMVDSASKTFNLAGLLNSHVVIPNKVIREKYKQYMLDCKLPDGSMVGKIAAKAAYLHGDKWLAMICNIVRINYLYLKDFFARKLPEVEIIDLQGTYLAWIDLSKVIKKNQIKDIVQTKARLAVDFGEWFGEAGTGFIRVNLATSPKNIKIAADRLVESIRSV